MEILLLLIGGVFFFVMGLLDLKKRRTLQNTPTSKIRSVAVGPVEIKGAALPAKEIISPLMKKKCAYYFTEIQEYKKQGKSSRYVTIKYLHDGRYFYVKDETGKIMVDAGAVIMDVPTKFTHKIVKKVDDPVRNLLDEQKINYKNFLGFDKNMRVVETIVVPGQNLYVFGTADNNEFVEDGTTTKNEDDLIIKRKKGNYFIISSKKEKDILKKMAWVAPLKIIGGGLAIAGSLIAIISAF